MAWRAPRYCHVHAIRDVGAGAISLDGDTAHADFPVDNLIDDRAQTLFMFSASVGNPAIDIDLGANWVTGLDRIIIPANHSFTSMRVSEADNAGFADPTDLVPVMSPVAGVQIAEEFDQAQVDRYIRCRFATTAQHYCPQIILTKIVEFDAGPNFEDSPDFYKANFTRLEQSTGQSPTIQHGPQQRVIEYPYESPLSGTDLAKMEALVADVGMLRPFWVDPHSFSATPEDDDPPIWMKFTELPRSRNSILVPTGGTESKVYPVSLIESLD